MPLVFLMVVVLLLLGYLSWQMSFRIEAHRQELLRLVSEQSSLHTENAHQEEELQKKKADLAEVQAQLREKKAVFQAELDLLKEQSKQATMAQLDEELKALCAAHPKTSYEEEISHLTKWLNEYREKYAAAHRQIAQEAAREDFVASHSISLTYDEKEDIALIREFAPRLGRSEAFFKLIWSEFYQKPLSALCKSLGVEKACGIYKITHVPTGKAYIGQALDIAARWKEHAKAGLGVGSSAYMTNKFYKALFTEGLENFTFEAVELVPQSSLRERELFWIETFDTVTGGYNSKRG